MGASGALKRAQRGLKQKRTAIVLHWEDAELDNDWIYSDLH